MSTATVMTCRKCGETLGSSYLYTADGFSYHHACYPVAPRDAEIARLQEQVEALTKEQDRCLAARDAAGIFPASPSETITILAEMSDAMLARAEAAEAERDRLREALRSIAVGKMTAADAAYIAKTALQKEPQP